MGAGASQNPEYEAAVSVFNDREHEYIRAIFDELSEGEKTVTEAHFQNFLKDNLPPVLITRLYDATCHLLTPHECGGNLLQGFDFHSFTVMLAYSLKGTLDQRSHVVISLAKKNTKCQDITGDELIEAVSLLVSAYMKMMVRTDQYKSWQVPYKPENDHKMAAFLTKDIAKPGVLDLLDCGEIERWLSKSAFVSHVMTYVFYTCFQISYVDEISELKQCTPKVPYCRGADWGASRTLLDLTSLVFLNHSVPVDHSRQWRLLFSSGTHGESFSTMLKYIVGRGPSLIILKDKEGHIFGGFINESWKINANYYGSPSCFLFTLWPQIGRFYPTGLNQNYVYLNQGQQTLPNGLGFGGQFGYFGLWLDSEYGRGHSKAEPNCSTYVSPRLSASAEFQFEFLEVWGVGPEPDEEMETKGSILDEDPAGKAMLSLIGKGPVSEGLREADPMADKPETHSLPPGM